MIKQWWENQERNRKVKWYPRQWQTWDCSLTLLTPTTYLLEHFASWYEFSKQRHNLIMRLEINMQILYGNKRIPSPSFPAVFAHESMDCQAWVYRTDICYLYTCFYIWSTSDFPLDILFECLWGKHQGFLEWLGFLKICLFLYLFYMNWKFCQTHFDCMENMFQSQKTAKKPKQGSCNSIKLGRQKSRKPS